MNVLIIGLGSIAKRHIGALRRLSGDFRIWALRSSMGGAGEEGVSNLYSLDAGGPEFDFAIISNPTSLHYPTIVALTEYRMPLFIEKPLFNSLDGGEDLVARCEALGIPTYVACNLRFHPCLLFLKDYLHGKQDQINEVNVYCGSYLPDWRPQADFRENYSARPELGGGVHLDLIHELDYIYWLFGPPSDSSHTLRSRSSLNIEAVDYANFVLVYEHFCAGVVLNYFRRDLRRQMEVVLADGTVTMDLVQKTVSRDGEVLFKCDIDGNYTYQRQMAYFVSAIRSGGKLMNDIREGLNVLKICLS